MEEYLKKDEDRKELFSRQLQHEITTKLISCNDVVDKFLNANSTSDDDKKALSETKVVDAKIRRLIAILTRSYHRENLKPLKIFIGALEETKNIELAKQLSLICDERTNSIGILNCLAKEKSSVTKLQREISRLKEMIEEKDYILTNLREEKRGLADQLRQTENEKRESIRTFKRELEIRISQKEEYMLTVGKEMDQIAIMQQQLEAEVKNKSLVIDRREKEVEEKENQLQNAIRESNDLRFEIEALQQNFVEVMGKEREQQSKKIETLESEILEKENKIEDLRRNQTLTRGELEEELKKITTGQEKKIDELTNIIKLQQQKNEQQNKKIDDLADNMNKLLRVVLDNKNT